MREILLVEIRNSFIFQDVQNGIFHEILLKNLINVIIDYYDFDYDFYMMWESVLNPQGVNQKYKINNDPRAIEHFKRELMKLLWSLKNETPRPVLVDLFYGESKFFESDGSSKNMKKFENFLEAIEFLFISGVNLAHLAHMDEPRRRMYNLWDHINNTDLQNHPILLALIKDLILKFPESEEFKLDETEHKILMDYLEVTDINKIRVELQGGMYEAPVYYYNREYLIPSSPYSMMTLWKNHKARGFIPTLRQCKKDLEKFLLRQIQLTVQNLNGLFLLTSGLNTLIAEYSIDSDSSPYPASSLAKKLLSQLEILRVTYSQKFTNLNAMPKVLNILEQALRAVSENQSVRYYSEGRDTHSFTHLLEYKYISTEAIEKLIKGVKIKYGSSTAIMTRFAQTEEKLFFLLKFLKDLPGEIYDPKIEKFILGLLALTNNMYKALKINKSLLENEVKLFSTLNHKSSMKHRMEAEKALNQWLETRGAEKWPVNFFTLDDKDQLIVYVKAEDQNAFIGLAPYTVVTMHLSPLFIHRGLEYASQVQGREIKWSAYRFPEREKIVRGFMSKFFTIEEKTISKFDCFDYYGYKLDVPQASHEKASLQLFPHKLTGKLSNPAAVSILKVIEPLQNALKLYNDQGDYAKRMNTFAEDFKNEYETTLNEINNHDQALIDNLNFLITFKQRLDNQFEPPKMGWWPSFFISAGQQKLQEAIVETKDLFSKLISSLKQLLTKSSEGEIGSMIHDIDITTLKL